MTCFIHGCHSYTHLQYLILKVLNFSSFTPTYIVSLLKNMANEIKAFRSLFKITLLTNLEYFFINNLEIN